MTDPTDLIKVLRARVKELETLLRCVVRLPLQSDLPEQSAQDTREIQDWLDGGDAVIWAARKMAENEAQKVSLARWTGPVRGK